MFATNSCHILLLVMVIYATTTNANMDSSFECGPYGFVCEGKSRLRLCEGENLLGPAFLCPPSTICNEDSSDVCESIVNYVDPAMRSVRCRRNERIADPSVPGCKGYILCIPNKNRFQGIKFTCTGDTIFNGITRTCSAPDRYRCPMSNITKVNKFDLFEDQRRIPGHESNGYDANPIFSKQKPRPIDCKNYKLTVTQEKSPAKAAYFCPARRSAVIPIKCTVFSNNFCIILEKDENDQFLSNTGAAFRKPRKGDNVVDVHTDY